MILGQRHADIVIPEGGKNDAAMELLVQWLVTKAQKCEASLLRSRTILASLWFLCPSFPQAGIQPLDQEPLDSRFRGNNGARIPESQSSRDSTYAQY